MRIDKIFKKVWRDWNVEFYFTSNRSGFTHGPRKFPWWKLFACKLYEIGSSNTINGQRLWIYTRWGNGFISWYEW